jgi:hypothetical protein
MADPALRYRHDIRAHMRVPLRVGLLTDWEDAFWPHWKERTSEAEKASEDHAEIQPGRDRDLLHRDLIHKPVAAVVTLLHGTRSWREMIAQRATIQPVPTRIDASRTVWQYRSNRLNLPVPLG